MGKRFIQIFISYEIMMEKSRMIVHEDEFWVRVTKKQYDMMKTSYETRRFKKMNDDDSLAEMLLELEKHAKTADNQIILFDYPEKIQKGKTYEDIAEIQGKKQTKKELDEEIRKAVAEELEKEEPIFNEVFEHIDEITAINEAVDELVEWLHDRGLDQGEEAFPLNDSQMNYIGFFDLAWPEGMLKNQREYSKPMALCLTDSSPKFLAEAKKRGFVCFTSVQDLKDYVNNTFLA